VILGVLVLLDTFCNAHSDTSFSGCFFFHWYIIRTAVAKDVSPQECYCPEVNLEWKDQGFNPFMNNNMK